MRNAEIRAGVFSAFELKILACVFMLIDHIGVILLPDITALRYIGRLAFPLFAYFIAEGCRYTKNKLRRFLSVFILGVVCEVVNVIATGSYYGNILLTFSVSILLIYLLSYVKTTFLDSCGKGVFALIIFALALCLTYLYCEYVWLDYGFFGVLAPVFAVLFDDMGSFTDELYRRLNRKNVSLTMFALSLVLISLFEEVQSYQIYSVLSLLLLAQYNGERGKYSLKYGFYLFYPLHLSVLYMIDIFL